MAQDARIIEEQSTRRRAGILGMSYIDTSTIIDKKLYPDVLTADEVTSLKVVPISADNHHISFGITNNTSQQTIDQLKKRFSDQTLAFSLISETGYGEYNKLYHPPKQIVYQDVQLSEKEEGDLFSNVTATLNQVLAEDILGYLVKQTFQLKGSDIHLECQKEAVRVRIRVDGVLHPIANLSYEKFKQLLSTVAIAANISTGDPDAQTGHINKMYTLATGESVTVNLRVETIPTAYGIDIVMRLFNLNLELLNIDKLGLTDNEREAVDDVIKHPSGMVLVVGPTGSGKTTTLYSIINTLNSPDKKIITLEDPIEYFMSGIVQIPVAGDQDREGFAKKLRAVLRLDPDIVMVGEIRDQDTARTALQASLTGHLVLSTFHAASAAAALTRMLDAIGVNPLFASAMHLVMAQRLVRRLDDQTKQSYKPDEKLIAQLQPVIDSLPPQIEKPNLNEVTFYRAGKSDENPFGYKGQMAIREQLMMTPGVREMLRLPPSQITTEALEKQAVEEGMLTMLQDGVLKAIAGETSLEEVYRVVG